MLNDFYSKVEMAKRGLLNSGYISPKTSFSELERRVALRTAFVARFVVLREGRRSKAHRMIEEMVWTEEATAEDVANMFRHAFIANGDKIQPVEKDLKKALDHAERSIEYFMTQYLERATSSFQEALEDYQKSNDLLFGEDEAEIPKSGGWQVVSSQLNITS